MNVVVTADPAGLPLKPVVIEHLKSKQPIPGWQLNLMGACKQH